MPHTHPDNSWSSGETRRLTPDQEWKFSSLLRAERGDTEYDLILSGAFTLLADKESAGPSGMRHLEA